MTICAPATAPGGAIAVIRVSGKDAIACVNGIFSKNILDARGYTMHHGHIQDVDDVIVSLCRAPHSYTGEDTAEISCHGSQYIVSKIISLLIAGGCRQAKPGEFTQRAFLNGKMDLTQAEAVADLIASQTASAHKVAMSHMRGGFAQKLSALRSELLEMTSLLELELDFTEEDVEFADRNRLLQLAKDIESEIDHLAQSFSTGNAIKNGIPVAIVGAPNVGKSTLLNLLLQEEKAIVSDIQGTTRDLIEDTITINGQLFRFIDTAGLRHTDDEIEKMGIARSLQALKKARIIILMTEPGVPYPDITASPEQTVIRIENKSKHFRAIDGTGLPWLLNELNNAIPVTTDNDILVTNIRHKEALDTALEDIRQGITSLNNNLPGDLVAEDLRQCLHHLSEITGGAISSDEVLQNIFHKFCIGK